MAQPIETKTKKLKGPFNFWISSLVDRLLKLHYWFSILFTKIAKRDKLISKFCSKLLTDWRKPLWLAEEPNLSNITQPPLLQTPQFPSSSSSSHYISFHLISSHLISFHFFILRKWNVEVVPVTLQSTSMLKTTFFVLMNFAQTVLKVALNAQKTTFTVWFATKTL